MNIPEAREAINAMFRIGNEKLGGDIYYQPSHEAVDLILTSLYGSAYALGLRDSATILNKIGAVESSIGKLNKIFNQDDSAIGEK